MTCVLFLCVEVPLGPARCSGWGDWSAPAFLVGLGAQGCCAPALQPEDCASVRRQELCDGAAEMLAPGGLVAFEVRLISPAP